MARHDRRKSVRALRAIIRGNRKARDYAERQARKTEAQQIRDMKRKK